ncbi:MAG: nucleotidyl transferase AbiEii/AbiGii toxin family protein [Bacteroidales bacterium]|nr:nucleotidyl transferase AbiEii/AbiGii toxin family protein [Bacteroidales bacterium]
MKQSAKSIRARLLNISRHENISFQLIIIRYFQERLLYRLSKSVYNNTFCLKGGVLLYLFEEQKSRPTMDIDFLAINTKNEIENLKTIFSEICQIHSDEDAVLFDYKSVETNEIIKQGNYNGIRIKVAGKLDTIKQNIQIDIGFGDKVYPNPILVKYPVILEMEQPEINAYSIYSAIAEKFEAMIQLSEANSRMKDFYDIYTILTNSKIDKQELENAVNLTFKTRNTIVSEKHSLFENDFYMDKNRLLQWKAFKQKAKISDNIEFETVMQTIIIELQAIYRRMIKQEP